MQQKVVALMALAAVMVTTAAAPANPPASSVNNLWRLAHEENFDGTMLNTNAWAVTDACGGSICRHPENVEVSDGTLKLNTLPANPLIDPVGVQYTTGRIDSLFTFSVGYTEVMVRAAEDSGIQSSVFSVLPADVMPNLMQTYEGDSNDGLTDWTLINASGGDFGAEFILDSGDPFPGATDLSADFHRYSLLWTEANELVWSADGAQNARTQAPVGLYAGPTTFAIGSAIRNQDFGIPRDPVGTAMEVDYLRYWTKRDICLGCDSFAYTGGSLAGAAGGKGWAGPWTVTGGSVEVEGLGENLGLEGASSLASAGDRFTGTAGAIAVRPLGTPVALNLDGATYLSMLVRKDDDGDFQVSFRRSSDAVIRWYFGGSANEQGFTGMTSLATASNVFPVNETVLVIAKVTRVNSTTGTDMAYLTVIREGDLVPQSDADIQWKVTTSTNSTVIMDYLDINVYGGNVQLDEIRIGNTLADVVSAVGAPSESESFDYADAGLDGEDGGAGWAGPWLADDGSVVLSNDDVSLVYPGSPSYENLFGNGDAVVLTNGSAVRAISDSFSLAEDNTYFMSFLAHKGAGSELLVEGLDGAGNSRWKAGLRGINEVIGGVTTIHSSAEGEAAASGSLDYPPAVPLNSNGSRIDQDGPGSAYMGLAANVPVSVAGGEAWISFLARKDSAGAFSVRVARPSDNVARWNTRVSADGTVRAEVFNGVNSAAGVFPNDETVLVITQFVGATTPNDMVKVAVLSASDPLPADGASVPWDAQVTDSTSVSLSRLLIDVVSGHVEIDEVRYGPTYNSVVDTVTGPYNTDSFDYAAGPIGGKGPWFGDLNIAGEVSDSLSYPALTPAITFTPDGGRIDHSGAGVATHPLSVVVSPDAGFTRWISFIARKDAAGSFAVRTKDGSTNAARWNLEFNADGSVRSEIFGGLTSAAGLFPNNEDVLVIGRFHGLTFPGLDTADILLLRAGDTLPASADEIDTNGLWDIHYEENTSVYMNVLVLEALTGHVQLDEIRYGSTYAAVTSSGSNLFLQDSFEYGEGPIEGNGEWSGDLNVAGPSGGFANDTVFVLSMYQARANGDGDTDTVYVKLFRSAYELPLGASAIGNWDLIVPGNSGVSLSKVRITATGPDPTVLDELKVGTTFAAVTNYTVPGDCDGDGDVDVNDFVECFEPCLSGLGVIVAEDCGIADLDGDGDVDLRDYSQFVQSY